MKTQKITKLTILIDVLKTNYGDYYKKYIGQDFLYSVHEDNTSDSIAYLMEHVRKLNPKDKEYPAYLQHCYAIFNQLQESVKSELEIAKFIYFDLIYENFTDTSNERSFLIRSAINDSDKLDELYSIIKNDKNEKLADVVLGIIDNYKDFEKDSKRKLSNIKSYLKYFNKCFKDLKK